ncbi:MAG: hypothetical protein ACQEXJ_16445 [Myxococcota bacterium]
MRRGRPNSSRAALVVGFLVLGAGGLTACPEWLEMPPPQGGDTGAPEPVALEGPPVHLPSRGPRVDGAGPLVPMTPGLRVPDGYWTRVRLDAADLLLPWTWAVAHTTSDGEGPHLVLRLLAAEGPVAPDARALRAVIPLAVPEGTRLEALEGLELGPEAMAQATIGLRTDARNRWLVTPRRLAITSVRPRVVVGTLEGVARRGSQGRRERVFQAGFLALRADRGPEAAGAPPGG